MKKLILSLIFCFLIVGCKEKVDIDSWQNVGNVTSVKYLPASFGSEGKTIIETDIGVFPVRNLKTVFIGSAVGYSSEIPRRIAVQQHGTGYHIYYLTD